MMAKPTKYMTFEYISGTSSGQIAWFVGEDPASIMDGRAIGPNGNFDFPHVSQRAIYMNQNLGDSNSWSEIMFGNLTFPTFMYIDYLQFIRKVDIQVLVVIRQDFPPRSISRTMRMHITIRT